MPRSTELWFGVIDRTMYLISGNGVGADWYQNLLHDPVVDVVLSGRTIRGHARPVEDADERRRVGDLMGAKYVWDGDPSIGLTYHAWSYTVPAMAVLL